MKNATKATLSLVFLGSAVFAQDLADAKKAIDAEQYQKAKTILKGLTASQPSNAENFFYLGNVYLANEYADSAKMMYNKGVAADNEEALNYVGLGTIDLLDGNKSGASTNFNKAAEMVRRKEYLPFLYIGKAYTIDVTPNAEPNPDYNQAITWLEKAKAVNQKDADIFLALGDAYRGLGKNSEAFSAYRTATELNKNLLRASVELGVIRKRAKAFAEAEAEFKKVIAADPKYGPAYRELAETYLSWGIDDPKTRDAKYKQALDFYKKYMDLTDRSIESRMRYADILVFTGDSKALEQEAQEMAKMDKANPRIHRYLGYAAYENGNYPASLQAMKDFFAKVDKKRLISSDYLYLGKAQVKAGEFDEGIATLKQAIEQDSTVAEGLGELAKELYNAREYAKSAKLYEIAVANPEANKNALYDNFFYGMAQYFDYATQVKENPDYTKEGLVKADSAFSYINQKSPTTPDAWLFRARTNRLLDDAENSGGKMVPYYEKFIEVISAKPEGLTDARNKKSLIEAYNNLGAYYLKTDQAKAKEYFNKTLALDPADSYASQVIKQLQGK